MIELHFPTPPKSMELVTFRIGSSIDPYDYSWLGDEGEILLKIVCSDGIFLLAKLPWCKLEDNQDRSNKRPGETDVLDRVQPTD